MISNWLSAALARKNIHYGWVMVGDIPHRADHGRHGRRARGVHRAAAAGIRWTTAEISGALSIRFVLFGLMAPFAAALLNATACRNVTLSALLIVVSALVYRY